MLLTGYGAYGYPLLDHVLVCAHQPARPRRASTRSRTCAAAASSASAGTTTGRMLNKQNTFSDFIAVAEQLIRDGRTAPDRLAIEGGSAGGLLIGAVVNARPELFRAALLDVPFVDVINTMSDAEPAADRRRIRGVGQPAATPTSTATCAQYSPYDNIRAQPYPALLVKTSYNDSQVMYWEPAKYVAKLRALGAGKSARCCCWVNMAAGHGGASGRYDQLLRARLRLRVRAGAARHLTSELASRRQDRARSARFFRVILAGSTARSSRPNPTEIRLAQRVLRCDQHGASSRHHPHGAPRTRPRCFSLRSRSRSRSRPAAAESSPAPAAETKRGSDPTKPRRPRRRTATLTLGAYTTPREVYGKAILPAFAKSWADAHSGQKVEFRESYLGSGAQARAIVSGFEADVAALSLEPDIEKVQKAGLITHDWKARRARRHRDATRSS